MEIYKKLFQILETQDYKKIFFLVFLIIVSMFLEMISIGILIPFFDTILSNQQDNFLFKIFKMFNFDKDFIVQFSLITLALIFLIKTIFISLIIFFKHRFIYNLNINLSSRITSKITDVYNLSLKENFSDLQRLILVDTSLVTNSTFQILNVISEITIIVASVLVLIYYEPFLLSIFLFFSLVILFLYRIFLKNKMSQWGDLRKINDTNRRKFFNDLLNTNIFAKLLNLKNTSYKKFISSNESTLKFYQLREMWNEIPRGLLELIAIIFILIIFFYFVAIETNIENIIPILSLFTLASLKIVMSLNRLIISFNQIFFAKTSINKVRSYFDIKNTTNLFSNSKSIKLETLQFINVSFHYYGKKNLFHKINFEIVKNDFIGVKGKSGSGKTTLLNLITGLIEPIEGKIILNKKFSYPFKKLKFGFVNQNPHILNDNIKNNIAFGLSEKKINIKKIIYLLKLMNLEDLNDGSGNILDFVISENASNISIGQAQRIAIARCLYFEPEIIILDEPSSALDRKNEDLILNILKNLKQNITIILVSHNPRILKYCHKVIDLDKKIFL